MAVRAEWRDGLLAVLCLGFTGLNMLEQAPLAAVVLDTALGIVASAGVFVRRRWPVQFAVLTGVAAIVS